MKLQVTLEQISVTALLSLAVTLITLGVNFLQAGEILPGVVCVVAGVAVMAVAVILYQSGIISGFFKEWALKEALLSEKKTKRQ